MATYDAIKLAEISVTIGDIAKALKYSEYAVELADRTCRIMGWVMHPTQIGSFPALGHALHLANRLELSHQAFKDAIVAHQKLLPHVHLHSISGYQYCELLLEDKNYGNSINGATLVRRITESNLTKLSDVGTLANGMDHLQAGRSWLAEAENRLHETDSNRLEKINSALSSAERHFDLAIARFGKSSEIEFQLIGIIRRAGLWRVCVNVCGQSCDDRRREMVAHHQKLAESDLESAEMIADKGSMLIWQIEAALERARLFFTLHQSAKASVRSQSEGASGDSTERKSEVDSDMAWLEQAQQKLDEAKMLIKQTEKPYVPHVPDWDEWEHPEYVGAFKEGDIVGYHCRNGEIERLQKLLDEAGS